MENYGLRFPPGPTLHRSEPSARPAGAARRRPAPRDGDMWFRHIVMTMRWWDDLWLNEAFGRMGRQLGCGSPPRAHSDAWASSRHRKQRGYAGGPLDAPGTRSAAGAGRRDRGAGLRPRHLCQGCERHQAAGRPGWVRSRSWRPSRLISRQTPGDAHSRHLVGAIATASVETCGSGVSQWLDSARPQPRHGGGRTRLGWVRIAGSSSSRTATVNGQPSCQAPARRRAVRT